MSGDRDSDGSSGAGRFRLEVRGLRKQFEQGGQSLRVLDGIDLELEAGQSLAVTGPSGSGKSTLLHILGTLDEATGGAVEIGGRNPFALAEPELARFRNEVIGFVFQDHHLLPQYSALENVLIPALAFGRPDAARQRRARELLERVGLGERADHRRAALSGGECQRAAVARALINAPPLLLCDEPTGNLDRAAAGAVAELLFSLHREEGNILVVVTHSEELAARCERRIELIHGRCAER